VKKDGSSSGEHPESAETAGRAESATPPKTVAREYLETIVVFVMILLFARSFVFMQSKIPTESMLDTLLVGDYILVNRFLYGAPGDEAHPLPFQSPIERGDVVVFRYPEDPDLDFVKRVIGLPGDRVEMRDGITYVNGEPLEEPYVEPENRRARRFLRPRFVPEDELFVMGDNRDNSNDSRAWGTVPRSAIKGKAFFIWYSFEEQKDDHKNTGLKRLWSMARKAIYFFGKTRWERLFSQIE
jgi:signal peptidase I